MIPSNDTQIVPGVGALERAFAIIRVLADAKTQGARVTQIAQTVGLTQATVHRTLQALIAQNMVEQDERSKHYRVSIDLSLIHI